MNANSQLRAVLYQANRFKGPQAPDAQPLSAGQSTQLELPGLLKEFPYFKPYTKYRPMMNLPALPEFGIGNPPAFYRQENAMHNMSEAALPNIKLDSQKPSGDLADVYYKLDEEERLKQTSQGAYLGSKLAYGPREGLPLGDNPTFITEYAKNLREAHVQKRVNQLVQEGYQPERIKAAFALMDDAHIVKKLSAY